MLWLVAFTCVFFFACVTVGRLSVRSSLYALAVLAVIVVGYRLAYPERFGVGGHYVAPGPVREMFSPVRAQ